MRRSSRLLSARSRLTVEYTPLGYNIRSCPHRSGSRSRPGHGHDRGVRMTTKRGYTASKEQLLRRLARVEGQVRGVARMVEEDRYCIDVLTQVSAARAALEEISLGLLDGHARNCVLGE